LAKEDPSTLVLLPSDRDKFFSFVLEEQEIRLKPEIQEIYREEGGSGLVEKAILHSLFKKHGYTVSITNERRYYDLTRKYFNDPELKPHIFFWRNNVMVHPSIGAQELVPNIPLVELTTAERIGLFDLVERAQSASKQFLVLFSGSIS
jgi:hypothetical protein